MKTAKNPLPRRKGSYDWLKISLLYAVILGVWQLCYFLFVEQLGLVKSYIFPSPFGIAKAFVKMLSGGSLLTAVAASFQKMLLGFSISLVGGTILGLLLTRFRFLSKALKPLALGFQTLPSICFVPFAVLWFGLKDSATIFVIVAGSLFSICIATESAIRNVSDTYIRAAKTMGASDMTVYAKVIFPASIPELISGLKQGWSFAWRALIAGEMVSGSIGGLGYILLIARELLEINQIMVVILVIILISVIIEKLVFGKIEKSVRTKRGQAV